MTMDFLSGNASAVSKIVDIRSLVSKNRSQVLISWSEVYSVGIDLPPLLGFIQLLINLFNILFSLLNNHFGGGD